MLASTRHRKPFWRTVEASKMSIRKRASSQLSRPREEKALVGFLNCGDQVAILPTVRSLASDVLEIATIRYISDVFLQLEDGRMFGTIGGKSLNSSRVSYAVPPTDEHRAALSDNLES